MIFFQFYSFWLILFKYPYCNRIVIVKVITITGCFAMYLITITITCNRKNQQLQITFWLLKACNRLHVITITDYNYNRSAGRTSLIVGFPCAGSYLNTKNMDKPVWSPGPRCSKLTMAFVNVSLKVWSSNMAYTLIFLLTNVSSFCICKSYSHFFIKNTVN